MIIFHGKVYIHGIYSWYSIYSYSRKNHGVSMVDSYEHHLVGGWPTRKMMDFASWGWDYPIYEMEKTCLKPPSSNRIVYIHGIIMVLWTWYNIPLNNCLSCHPASKEASILTPVPSFFSRLSLDLPMSGEKHFATSSRNWQT